MCRIPRAFSDLEEYCDRYQFDECKLRCYAIRLFDFLNECFVVDKESLQIINDDFSFFTVTHILDRKHILLLKISLNGQLT